MRTHFALDYTCDIHVRIDLIGTEMGFALFADMHGLSVLRLFEFHDSPSSSTYLSSYPY